MSETNPAVMVSPSDAVDAPAPEASPAPAAVPGVLTPEPPAPTPTPVEEETQPIEELPLQVVEGSTAEAIEYPGSVVDEEPVQVETVPESKTSNLIPRREITC